MGDSTTTQNPHTIYELKKAAQIAIICGYSRQEFMEMAAHAITDEAVARFKTKKAVAQELKCNWQTAFGRKARDRRKENGLPDFTYKLGTK